MGIQDDINKCDNIDDIFITRYMDRLHKKFGIEAKILRVVIITWCNALAMNYLGKTVT